MLGAALAAPSSTFAAPKTDPKAEAKAKEKIAEAALLGRGAAGLEARAEALRPLTEAERCGRGGDKRDPTGRPGQGDARRARRRRRARRARPSCAAELAKGYEKLAGLPHEPADAPRFEGYLFKPAELEPTKARLARLFSDVKQALGNKGQAEVGGRMLVRLRG